MGKRFFLLAVVLLMALCSTGCGVDYDGLIVDTGDNTFKPALINKIFSESGWTVYDPSSFGEKILFEEGAGEYVNGIGKAKVVLEQKGVKNPLIVKATGSASSSDIIVSDKDAKKILSADKKTGFLHKAKVAFVLASRGDMFSMGEVGLKNYMINENFMKVVAEGVPNPSDKDKQKSAIVSSMIISLRNFGEAVFELKKLIADYEAAEKRGDKKFLDKNKDLYTKAKLYTKLFREFRGESSFGALNYDLGEFSLKSKTLIKGAIMENDIVTLTFKDGKQITVRDFALADTLDMKQYFMLRRILNKLGFHGDFKYDSKTEIATFVLMYTR